ncbi:molybdenum cofactor guanylyltransferase [Alkalihalobacillus sp. TS-13]|uniref:molybdenum cofactor guanylyltransferase n=1 Tax=Alkalihalobacillus sp. TS-13 TaxID=2842455 RepID=UPI001C88BFFF|nr:molybdenum cofactor guanylyltransferase [Alkalihalobacillus sp. TS-13]
MKPLFAGIVLAGGESRRYGTAKALEEIEGRPFYKIALEILQPLVEHIVVVAHPSLQSSIDEQEDVTVIMDDPEFRGEGPLAGIYSGMKAYEAAYYLVLACDMPLMKQQVYRQLISLHFLLKTDCSIVPGTRNRVQPLAALYPSAVKPVLFDLLKNERRRLTDLLSRLECAYISYHSHEMTRCFRNINTPADYKEMFD